MHRYAQNLSRFISVQLHHQVKTFNRESLEYRRFNFDLILCHKIVSGFSNTSLQELFHFALSCSRPCTSPPIRQKMMRRKHCSAMFPVPYRMAPESVSHRYRNASTPSAFKLQRVVSICTLLLLLLIKCLFGSTVALRTFYSLLPLMLAFCVPPLRDVNTNK